MKEKTQRTCPKGHKYYKSSDCPTCPVCESNKMPDGFLAALAAPARRALQHRGITTLKELSTYSMDEILQLHGMGPNALQKLKVLLKEAGYSFKNK